MFSETQLTSVTLYNFFALLLSFYFNLSSKCSAAVNYLQEQLELYSIASRFIYEQAAPKINLVATSLTVIQLSSLAVIFFVLYSRIKSSFSNRNKRVKIRRGDQIEVIELVRVTREKSRKPPEQTETEQMNSIAPIDASASFKKEAVELKPFEQTQIVTPPETIAEVQSPLKYGEKARLFYESQAANSPPAKQNKKIIQIVQRVQRQLKAATFNAVIDEPVRLSFAEKARLFYEKNNPTKSDTSQLASQTYSMNPCNYFANN